jgi:hypothetical protein
MEQQVEKVYVLGWSTDHIKGQQSGMRLIEFPGSDNVERLMNVTPYKLPETVVFRADFKFLSQTDYPPQSQNWPLMSRRMYEVLLSVGDFPHRVIPVTMESTKLDSSQPNYRTIDSDSFVAIQFLEYADYFDCKRSIYSSEGNYPTHYFLNEPSEGFPPVFRLAVNPGAVFITAEARGALKEAGILGTAYTPTSNIQLSREVDLPVPIVGIPSTRRGSTYREPQ